ncbi:hypothetical protein F441_21413 [Phytophthora nicotianae CJ01A1]|uniref:Uncharacterized protein n=5 Tax=Phytophthora nicotianae TaxID=4792 RepID=W2QUS5_PHYN3|nr:hypothetical protein PPTG_21856 [Phytophthora nicotianae INRA-310]ETK71893.1 hypothetical protein L915_20927 [Phytophthora nicotianae]ETO60229.1 hypothetical protein F444_21543 [Phytophthora nicotianae P1976]ETP01320.1 hypothetical protein F441_21413 [Phytophthora nicotianae CJ01A1]ETP29480.1 hypothetical protein F442_21369 [Phytophthora nicotianae P10297]ETL78546.1 hypothetical protein L917_20659 [Phytophthora nicotianae]
MGNLHRVITAALMVRQLVAHDRQKDQIQHRGCASRT